MVASLISGLVVLTLGTLYPAYQSYKAVKKRDPKGYVKWMMYWIVFALFTSVETFADIFASILPLYYEFKIIFILWLISPWTKGSTYLYRKFVHPTLSKRESEIDEYLNHASTKGYEALKKVGTDGLTIAANVMVNSAMKGQTTLLEQLKNYSSLQKSGVPALTTGEPAQEEGPDGDRPLYDNDAFIQEYEPSSEEDTDDYQQPSADIRGSLADVRGPDIWGPDVRGMEMSRGHEVRGYDGRGRMVQSMYEPMDNRYVEEQYYDPMVEVYIPEQSSSRAHRLRLISADKSYHDSEGSDQGFEETKRHSLRRTTSGMGTLGRHPSTEDLAYSKRKYASTENIAESPRLRRSRRQQIKQQEMIKRAARHRQYDPRPPAIPNPQV